MASSIQVRCRFNAHTCPWVPVSATLVHTELEGDEPVCCGQGAAVLCARCAWRCSRPLLFILSDAASSGTPKSLGRILESSRRRRDRSSSAVAPWQMERPVVSLREPRDRRGDPSGWGTGAPRRGCTRSSSRSSAGMASAPPRRRDAAIALPTRHHPEHCAQRLRREGVV